MKELDPAPLIEQDDEEPDCGEATYLPSRRGLIFFSAMGLRADCDSNSSNKGAHSFKMPEFRVANRDVPIPAGLDLAILTARSLSALKFQTRCLR